MKCPEPEAPQALSTFYYHHHLITSLPSKLASSTGNWRPWHLFLPIMDLLHPQASGSVPPKYFSALSFFFLFPVTAAVSEGRASGSSPPACVVPQSDSVLSPFVQWFPQAELARLGLKMALLSGSSPHLHFLHSACDRRINYLASNGDTTTFTPAVGGPPACPHRHSLSSTAV